MALTEIETRKAREIIARYALEAYREANTTKRGTRRKRHRPYTVPAIAEALTAALSIADEREREHEIKRLFEIERMGAWSLI